MGALSSAKYLKKKLTFACFQYEQPPCYLSTHLLSAAVFLYTGVCFYSRPYIYLGPSHVALVVKNLHANVGDIRSRFIPLVGRIPCRRAWQPIPVFLPGESHGLRNMAGCSPWGHKGLDMTEVTYTAWTHLCLRLPVSIRAYVKMS